MTTYSAPSMYDTEKCPKKKIGWIIGIISRPVIGLLWPRPPERQA